MKLDLDAINKLNPPGLLYLEALSRLIHRLIAGLDVQGPANDASLKYARMIGRLTRQYREGLNFNQNMRIRMWVLACAQRRAWVRSVIGEAVIGRWQQKYDILSGFAPRMEAPARKPAVNPNAINKCTNNQNKPRKPVEPKQFALPNLSEIFFRPITSIQDIYVPDPLTRIAPLFQPRPARHLKPVEFSPHELSPDYIPLAVREDKKIAAKPTQQSRDNSENIEPDPPPRKAREKPGYDEKTDQKKVEEEKPP